MHYNYWNKSNFDLLNYFFFSSRRRDTSWPRDWSSDVCSSDLKPLPRSSHLIQSGSRARSGANSAEAALPQQMLCGCEADRSEERRVGKESRGEVAGGVGKKSVV